MNTETRNKRIIRELNEELTRNSDAVKGMSPGEKHVLVVVAAVVFMIGAGVVLALWAGNAWSVTADTDPPPIPIKCDAVTRTCEMKQDDLAKVSSNYFAVLAELEALRKTRCGKHRSS